MNRSKIEWCDHTWNPITGCRHGCPYCYAMRMSARFSGDVRLNKMAKGDYSLVPAADGGEGVYELDAPMVNETGSILVYPFGFEPTYHRYRLNVLDKLKMGNNIFVGSMADIFGSWVPDRWLDAIFSACIHRPIHNYLFLTKNPGRYIEYGVPAGFKNLWYGTSITREGEMGRFRSLPAECQTFVSMEPVLEDLEPEHHVDLFKQVNWIIIGAETGRSKNRVVPELAWIEKIVTWADSNGVPVFMKESLEPIVGGQKMRRDFPEQLLHLEISPKMKERLLGVCAKCKAEKKKRDMVTLLARSKRGEQPKQFGFMCKCCFKKLCKELDLDVPALEGMEDGHSVSRDGTGEELLDRGLEGDGDA